MFRLTLLALLVPSFALAAPLPKDGKKELLYFPVKVGTKMVYESKTGDVTREVTETVTKMEVKDGTYTVTVGRAAGRPDVYEVSDKGLANKKEATPELKLGGKPGDTWTAEMVVWSKGPTVKRTYTLGKEEELEVPAGKYKAIRVDFFQTDAGRTLKVAVWYAPGVGPVKFEAKSSGGRGKETTTTTVLKSFTPGNDDKPKKDK